MMGANWGYSPGPRQNVTKKYAWFPTKTNSGRWIWFNEYYLIQTFYDENGKPPVKTLYWHSKLSKNEYLIWLIKNPQIDIKLPNVESSIKYYKQF